MNSAQPETSTGSPGGVPGQSSSASVTRSASASFCSGGTPGPALAPSTFRGHRLDRPIASGGIGDIARDGPRGRRRRGGPPRPTRRPDRTAILRSAAERERDGEGDATKGSGSGSPGPPGSIRHGVTALSERHGEASCAGRFRPGRAARPARTEGRSVPRVDCPSCRSSRTSDRRGACRSPRLAARGDTTNGSRARAGRHPVPPEASRGRAPGGGDGYHPTRAGHDALP